MAEGEELEELLVYFSAESSIGKKRYPWSSLAFTYPKPGKER